MNDDLMPRFLEDLTPDDILQTAQEGQALRTSTTTAADGRPVAVRPPRPEYVDGFSEFLFNDEDPEAETPWTRTNYPDSVALVDGPPSKGAVLSKTRGGPRMSSVRVREDMKTLPSREAQRQALLEAGLTEEELEDIPYLENDDPDEPIYDPTEYNLGPNGHPRHDIVPAAKVPGYSGRRYKHLDPDQPLTRKQTLFCDYYAATLSSERAARLAGYTGSFRDIGQRNLRRPNIQKRLAKLFQASAITRDEVLARLAKQATGSIGDFITINPDTGDFAWDFAKAERAGKLDLIRKLGELRGGGLSVELYNAQTALTAIARIIGMTRPREESDGKLRTVDGDRINIVVHGAAADATEVQVSVKHTRDDVIDVTPTSYGDSTPVPPSDSG